MNAIRFAIYTGIIWAVASVLLIEISVIQGAETAWVELDFRFLSGITLVLLHSLDIGGSLSEVINYMQFGMPINGINVIIAIITGFVDGFVSGFFIAIFYNFLSIISEGKNFPTTIKFGISTGIVLAICSGLLALVSVQYNFEIESFGFAIRPVFLTFLGISNLIEITQSSALATISESYLLFPDSNAGAISWTLWGFVDGFIGGVLISYFFTRIKKVLRPVSIS
ncbi:MAG: hypothetical protein WBB48_07810 [Thermodesulfobacteriota bacterium]